MHAATWALAAACKRRDTESVGKIWRSVSPPVRGENAEAYWAEPYVTPGNVDGPTSDLPGRAGWTWYTGSAAWLNRVSLEWVLGVRPTWRGLLVDPVPPRELGVVRAERRWRGVKVVIGFDSAAYRPEERARIVVNGRELRENVIDPSLALAAAAGDGVLNVEVNWVPRVPGAESGVPRTSGAGVSESGVGKSRPASEMRGTQEAQAEKVAT
jgi:cellobiose phosphorylase